MKKIKTDGVVFLRGKKIVLRPPAESDIPLLTKWINNPEIRQFIKRVFPATTGDERDWLESLRKRTSNDVVLAIVTKDCAIGVIGIHHIDWTDRLTEMGIYIGEKRLRGHGYGSDAVMALAKYAFDTLGLHKIVWKAKAFNRPSIDCARRCGFVIEGRLKRQHFVDGRYHDEIILGLFKNDWLPQWKKHIGK
jgi:RimJ/RimL family protein N-acetyltransferase